MVETIDETITTGKDFFTPTHKERTNVVLE